MENTTETSQSSGPVLLRLEDISKSFPGVKALQHVHLEVYPGEVHALLGENGAGKSTLMKILSGAYTKDSGNIIWEGESIEIHDPHSAQQRGIGIIYQEFNLVPQLSIAENVWIGREPFRNPLLKLLDWDKMFADTASILQELHLDLDPRQPVAGLGVAMQQMVEIAKALSLNARLLIMDEPTSALSENEINQLFDVIRKLRSKGVAVIYISHHLDEVFQICDRGTILRDGQYIATVNVAATTHEELIQLMVGRSLEQQFPKVSTTAQEEALRVQGLTVKGVLEDISFSAYTGEILGIAGLVGAGRTELMKSIFGANPIDAGQIFVFGQPVKINSPEQAIRAGIGLLPEDRKQEGLVLLLSVMQNITLASLDKLSNANGLLCLKEERNKVSDFIDRLRILTPGMAQKVEYLSGGNQQKVVLAKWLASQSKILIFDEPTRGIDVGAKVEVYNLMNLLIQNGVAVIMVSSEMPELLGMSDRIIVMHEGQIAGEFTRDEATQEKILSAAMGVQEYGTI